VAFFDGKEALHQLSSKPLISPGDAVFDYKLSDEAIKLGEMQLAA